MRMPFCDETDEHGRYEIANLWPAVYFVDASARTYRAAMYPVVCV